MVIRTTLRRARAERGSCSAEGSSMRYHRHRARHTRRSTGRRRETPTRHANSLAYLEKRPDRWSGLCIRLRKASPSRSRFSVGRWSNRPGFTIPRSSAIANPGIRHIRPDDSASRQLEAPPPICTPQRRQRRCRLSIPDPENSASIAVRF